MARSTEALANESAVTQVCALLPKLSRADLETVTGRIKALASLTPGEKTKSRLNDALPFERMVLESVERVCREMHIDYVPAEFLANSKGMTAFREKLPPLEKWLHKAHRRSVGQRSLMIMGLRLVARSWLRSGQPMSAVKLMQCVHLVPGQLNEAFPGYAGTGLLEMVLDRSTKAARI